MRVAFFGIYGSSRYPFAGTLPFNDGMPRSSATDLNALLELYDRTDNKGNMMHGEAPTRFLDIDREHSCYVSVQALSESGWSAERISETLSNQFDIVIFSTANALRPNLNPGCTAKVLEGLTKPFLLLGLGLQNPLPTSTSALHPNLIELLDVCNRKACLFGVRGFDTEGWLKSVGYGRAQALGCPSMFVYPQNILGIRAVDPARVRTGVTGGYLSARIPRATILINLFKGIEIQSHYVMQEEMANWRAEGIIQSAANIFNDATGEVNEAIVDQILGRIHDEKMPFKSYRWFQEPSAWRAFVSCCDFYLGDRLHGGVAALQAGTPAVLMANDRRVFELGEFFGMPMVSVADAEWMTVQEILADQLSRTKLESFKETYAARFRNFRTALRDCGLSVVTDIDTLDASKGIGLTFPQDTPKRRAARAVRTWLRRL